MTVHVIATGGTIGSHFDGEMWTEVDGPTLIAELGPLPHDVLVHSLTTGPSSNLSRHDMLVITLRVSMAIREGARGVVVVHGTDTMELTAFVAQLLLGTSESRPPIVVTGSMRPHSHPQADGPANLRDALAVAAHPDAIGRDVMVCMGGELHAADRVRKRSAVSVDAFDSAPLGPIGHVAEGAVTFVEPRRTRTPGGRLPGPVPLVTCWPGISAEEFIVAAAGASAVVVEGYGDLNVPHALWRPIHAAAQRGVLVVLTSSAFTDSTGDADLRMMGAVGAGGLSTQKARLATMAALGATTTRDEAVAFLHQYALAFDAGERGTST